MTYAHGDRVTVTVPICAGVVVPMKATRVNVRTWHGTVTGPVQFEPGMVNVRRDGAQQAERVLTEYLTPDASTLAGRRQLCQTPGVTLGGQPAVIAGAANPFATVATRELGPAVEYAWPVVARVVAAGGRFQP